jgi:hypothetical protein
MASQHHPNYPPERLAFMLAIAERSQIMVSSGRRSSLLTPRAARSNGR